MASAALREWLDSMGSEDFSNLDSLPENHWGGLWPFWIKTRFVYHVKDRVVKFSLKLRVPQLLVGNSVVLSCLLVMVRVVTRIQKCC